MVLIFSSSLALSFIFVFIEPTQIVRNEMRVLAAFAFDQHNPIMIGIFGESADRSCVTFCTCEH